MFFHLRQSLLIIHGTKHPLYHHQHGFPMPFLSTVVIINTHHAQQVSWQYLTFIAFFPRGHGANVLLPSHKSKPKCFGNEEIIFLKNRHFFRNVLLQMLQHIVQHAKLPSSHHITTVLEIAREHWPRNSQQRLQWPNTVHAGSYGYKQMTFNGTTTRLILLKQEHALALFISLDLLGKSSYILLQVEQWLWF